MKEFFRRMLKGARKVGVALLVVVTFITSYLVIDSITGHQYDRTLHPVVIAQQGDTKPRLIVHLPGFMSNRWATVALADYLSKHGTVVGFPFPEGKLTPENLFSTIKTTLNTQRHAQPRTQEVWVLAQSMGAKVFRDFAAWLKDNDVELLIWLRSVTLKLILDTAPASEDDLKAPFIGFRIIEVLDWLGLNGGWITTTFAVRDMQERSLKGYPTALGSNLNTVSEGQKAFAATTATAISSQLAFLSRYRLPNAEEIGDLKALVDQAMFVSGEGPNDDPIIKITQAITNWYAVFPTMRVGIVSDWDPKAHSPNLERPSRYAQMVIDAFA